MKNLTKLEQLQITNNLNSIIELLNESEEGYYIDGKAITIEDMINNLKLVIKFING